MKATCVKEIEKNCENTFLKKPWNYLTCIFAKTTCILSMSGTIKDTNQNSTGQCMWAKTDIYVNDLGKSGPLCVCS